MHEVITISVGQRANHTATQFFNCQQELLCVQDERLNEPSIFLNPTIDKISKTVSYTPRSLIWDAKNGSGALGLYQYSQSNDYYFDEDKPEFAEGDVIVTHPAVPKSGYQRALDHGSTELPELTRETTQYWSDYSKLIYAPTSFNSLQNWYHDTSQPNLPDYENLGAKKFDNFDTGFQEFNDNYLADFFDGNFHSQLELCDTLQGFNLIADMDSGWGGFSTAMVQEIRNELPKKSIFYWGYGEDDPLTASVNLQSPRFSKSKLQSLENKIKSVAYMSEECDVMIPLYANTELTNWEQAGLSCKFVDAVSSVLSQSDLDERKSMDEIKQCLTANDSTRNIISSLLDENGLQCCYFAKLRPLKGNVNRQYHVFSECDIVRGSRKNETEPINKNTLKTFSYHPSDTIPQEFRQSFDIDLSFSSSEACMNVFKHYQYVVNSYMRNIADKEEIKDLLGSIASQYEHGWYDEDSGDDDV